MTEHDPKEMEAADWEAAYAGDVPETPVDGDVIELARDLEPGDALDLGCGSGQNSIWLAQQGWTVHGVDIAGGAIERARAAAERSGLSVSFEKADLTSWRTNDRYDLVVSTYALPPRGPGRVHALTTVRDAVAPGGTALIAEFEVSLAESGWMSAENLVTLDEIDRDAAGLRAGTGGGQGRRAHPRPRDQRAAHRHRRRPSPGAG